jgi:nicotinamide mononucleotide transporter
MSLFGSLSDAALTTVFTALGYEMSVLELIAVITSLLGVWLGTTGRQIMWPWWGLSSALYCWLFFEWQLYASALLQIVFIAAAVWGWFGWGPKGATAKVLSWRNRTLVLGLGLVIWLAITPVLISWGAAAAKPDAFGLVFSVIAQVMMVLEFRENWVVWLVVDAAYTILYWQQDLKFTSILYVLFTAIALRGWTEWNETKNVSSLEVTN